MFNGNVTMVTPVIPMVRIIAGTIPTIVNKTVSASPINAKITAIIAWMDATIPAYTILNGVKMKPQA